MGHAFEFHTQVLFIPMRNSPHHLSYVVAHMLQVKFHQLITDDVLAALELDYDMSTKKLKIGLEVIAVRPLKYPPYR